MKRQAEEVKTEAHGSTQTGEGGRRKKEGKQKEERKLEAGYIENVCGVWMGVNDARLAGLCVCMSARTDEMEKRRDEKKRRWREIEKEKRIEQMVISRTRPFERYQDEPA